MKLGVREVVVGALGSLPMRERELKLTLLNQGDRRTLSLPMRERELKRLKRVKADEAEGVAPHAGA